MSTPPLGMTAKAALQAVIAYDNAIKKRVLDGSVQIMETGGAVAMGDDLDDLYEDMIAKTQAALSDAETT